MPQKVNDEGPDVLFENVRVGPGGTGDKNGQLYAGNTNTSAVGEKQGELPKAGIS
jgi:hypothetical protein